MTSSKTVVAPYLFPTRLEGTVMLMRSTRSENRETDNLLLRHLSEGDRALLDPGLERIAVKPGDSLFKTNDELISVYFPESAIVSIERRNEARQGIETALIGREGMVGWSAMMGSVQSSHDATVQISKGTILRISLGELSAACLRSGTLFTALIRFVEIIMVQMAQAITSTLRDTMEPRVCRWLLMRHDRIAGGELAAKHDEISANLGVRRASVTDCLHVLEGERLIRCFRGRIVIKDRGGLEERAGASYGTSEMLYRALIGPFGHAVARPVSMSKTVFRHETEGLCNSGAPFEAEPI